MKKIVSLILAVALIMAMAAIPAMAEGETEVVENKKYQVRGIRNGDVIVANEETSRVISIVTAASADIYNETVVRATDLTKVEFYDGNNNLLDTADSYPYEYTLKFDSLGEHTLKTVVYYTDDSEAAVYEVFESDYRVVLGKVKTGVFSATRNSETNDNIPYSFSEDFEGENLVFADLDWVQSVNTSYTATVKDGAVNLTPSNGGKYVNLECFGKDTGTDVIYYSMDVNTNGTTMLFAGFVLSGTSASMCNVNTKDTVKVRVIVNLNNGNIIFNVDGQESRRYIFDATQELFAGARLRFTVASKATVTLDNVTCTSYDLDETASFGVCETLGGETYTDEYTVTAEDIANGSVIVKTRAMNTTDEPKTLTNIIAVYDAYDKLIEVPFLDKNISYGVDAFGEKEYPVSLPVDAAKVRVFTWNGLDTLVPVSVWGE